jgi:trimethylamine--corrinoid protein Co-methyltransferase
MGPSFAPIARLAVPWAPLEILSAEQVERILTAAYRILEEAGMEIRSAAARAVYLRHGANVEEESQIVRLGRDVVEAHLKHAPEQFVLRARNRQRDLHVGGNIVNFGPVNGAPNISDLERGRRYGDLEAFRNILRLTHALGILHWQGGIVVDLSGSHRVRRYRLGRARHRRRAGGGRHCDVGDRTRMLGGGFGGNSHLDDGYQCQFAAPR